MGLGFVSGGRVSVGKTSGCQGGWGLTSSEHHDVWVDLVEYRFCSGHGVDIVEAVNQHINLAWFVLSEG